MTSIALYITLVNDFLDFSNFIIKFSAMLNYKCSSVTDNFNSLYSL